MRFSWLKIIAFLVLGSVLVQAQSLPFTSGFQNVIGARAMGMGGSFTAVADDYSSLYYNPAGLGQIKTMYLYGNFSFLSMDNTSTYYGFDNLMETSVTNMDGIGVAIPVPTIRGSLVLGFSHQRVRDFSGGMSTAVVDLMGNNGLEFDVELGVPPDNVYALIFDATVSGEETIEGEFGQTSFGASMEVAPDVFVGGSLNFWSGIRGYTWQYREIMGVYDVFDIPNPDDAWIVEIPDYILDTYYQEKFTGINFTLGALMKAHRFFQVGGVIKSPVTLTAKRDWDQVEEIIPYTTNDVELYEDNGTIDYKIQSPWIFRAGGAITAGPLMVTGDVELYDYSQIKYKTDPPEDGTTMAQANRDIRGNLQSTVNYHVGGQITLPGGIASIRGGYGFYPSPWKDADKSWDREILTFGAGLVFSDRVHLDVAYMISSWNNPTGGFLDAEKFEIKKLLTTISFTMNQ